jgi:hypothetical protein
MRGISYYPSRVATRENPVPDDGFGLSLGTLSFFEGKREV